METDIGDKRDRWDLGDIAIRHDLTEGDNNDNNLGVRL